MQDNSFKTKMVTFHDIVNDNNYDNAKENMDVDLKTKDFQSTKIIYKGNIRQVLSDINCK